MTVSRRLCRALACPRHVDHSVVFCDVHWNQLQPRLQDPIAGNREAPAGATPAQVGASLGAIDTAVTVIAKKEGRARALKQAKAAAFSTVAPATTAAGGVSSSGGDNGRSIKVDEPIGGN